MIYTEQANNYDFKDVLADSLLGRFIERQVRISKFKNPAINIDYVAGLVKNIVNNWKTDYPEIVESPDIVWTIYNTGNNFDTPHSNPKPGALADFALENYNLMGELLYD